MKRFAWQFVSEAFAADEGMHSASDVVPGSQTYVLVIAWLEQRLNHGGHRVCCLGHFIDEKYSQTYSMSIPVSITSRCGLV